MGMGSGPDWVGLKCYVAWWGGGRVAGKCKAGVKGEGVGRLGVGWGAWPCSYCISLLLFHKGLTGTSRLY